jgi:hypothetical protein
MATSPRAPPSGTWSAFPSTVSPTAEPTTSAIRRHWYGTGKTCWARTVMPRNITT